jgi:hypothetical protein
MKIWMKIYCANTHQKKAREVILMPEKNGFGRKDH